MSGSTEVTCHVLLRAYQQYESLYTFNVVAFFQIFKYGCYTCTIDPFFKYSKLAMVVSIYAHKMWPYALKTGDSNWCK